jgi:hypothetical protein
MAACADGAAGALAGRWVGQRVESLGRPPSAAQTGWARGTSLGFAGSKITVQLPGELPRSGHFRVLRDDDGQIDLSVTGHDGHEDHARLTLETPELLRWHVDAVHTVVMSRP